MKKIYACLNVQNDADIVESLCRYYCCFCDGILVRDDQSSDNTLDILKSLNKEGLPVHIIGDEDVGVNLSPIEALFQIYHLAVDRYDADLILPIDADEFLVCVNGGNPRIILEALDETEEHHFYRRNYIYTDLIKENNIFFPLLTNKYVDLTSPKAIIHRFLLKEKKVYTAWGNHGLLYNKDYSKTRIISNNLLCYNHYPIRSQNQFMIKIILGWLYCITNPHSDVRPWHWEIFYDEIKRTGTISKDMLKIFSIYNSKSIPREGEYNLTEENFDLSFCNDNLILQYTKYDNNQEQFMQLLTRQLEKNLLRIKTWYSNKERDYNYNLNKLMVINEELSLKFDDLNNSKSWKITKPLRDITHLLRKCKKKLVK